MKTPKLIVALLFALCSVAEAASSSITRIENPPPPIDIGIIDRLWQFAKEATGAPSDIKPPLITLDWEVPILARMGTQYPTIDDPSTVLQISIAPRTIDMWPIEMVQYGIGHEMIHYLLILQENNWDATRKTFVVVRKHHCDPEFKRLTKGIADKLWDIWHSDSNRIKMYDEIQKSCANFPDQ